MALILAFLLWLMVYNMDDDPMRTKNFTTNVTILNGETITSQNKYYEVTGVSNMVTFAVTAKRSVLDKLENADFKAYADMKRLMVGENQTAGSVPIDISCSRYSSSSIKYTGGTKYLTVSLENLMIRQFVITPSTKGKVLSGYALGDVSVSNQNVLKVSGPESIVSKVDHVMAVIDVEGMSQNISDNVLPVLYDANGKAVDTTRLTLSNRTVSITAKILGTKQVAVLFNYTGEPKEDYSVTSIQGSLAKVYVKGTAANLNPVSAIMIPPEILNVDGMENNLETSVDITEYLPEGVELVDNSQSKVNVVVKIEQKKVKSFALSRNQITFEGLEDGHRVILTSEGAFVEISGTEQELATMKVGDLDTIADVGGLTEGEHTVVLEVKNPDTVAGQIIRAVAQVKLIRVFAEEETPVQPPITEEPDSEQLEGESNQEEGTDFPIEDTNAENE